MNLRSIIGNGKDKFSWHFILLPNGRYVIRHIDDLLILPGNYVEVSEMTRNFYSNFLKITSQYLKNYTTIFFLCQKIPCDKIHQIKSYPYLIWYD